MTGTTPDVLIVGGGVIGLTTAYYLAVGGARVVVLEQGELGREASWAGAGIIPPGGPNPTAPIDRLRTVSAVLYPDLSAELRERTGIDNGYRRCGGLEFFAAENEAPEAAWRAEGIRYETPPPKVVRAQEPALGTVPPIAYHLPDLAQVRNPRHVQALAAACTALGVNVRPHEPVVGFGMRHSRIVTALTPSKPWAAHRFLVTAGAWSDRVLSSAGVRLGVRPVRGQIVLYHAERPLFRSVLMVGKRYLVPREDGRILAGSTEEDVGFDKSTTLDGIAGLKSFARQTVPALADVPVEATWAGLRPVSRDGLPLMGPVPKVANLFVAAGHFRAGIQLSPASGRAMADLLLGREPIVELAPFRVDRPPAPPAQTAFRS